MNLESSVSSEEKKHWRIVRTDNYTDVQGEIVTADETTGECTVSLTKPDGTTETKTLSLGAGGLRIVRRRQ